MSPVTRRETSRKETQALILASARTLFRERGFDQTSTRELAEQAGVATGTVFKHFPDKDALLTGILLVELDEVLAGAWASLPDTLILDQLMHFVDALYGFYAQDPGLSRALIRATTFSPGPASEEASAQVLQFLSGLATLVQAAKVRGELRIDLDTLSVTRTFFASYLLVLIEFLGQPVFDPIAARLALKGMLLESMNGWKDLGEPR